MTEPNLLQPTPTSPKLRVAALFAGIGGIELGLQRAGHETRFFCEIDKGATAVLHARFPSKEVVPDIREIEVLPADIDLLTAGFPCQDLSQAGETKGIGGEKSGLVENVFRLLESRPVPWVLLENVSFMLRLHKGAAMGVLVNRLEALGYSWAYRVVDSRAFGLPQRRERVFLLASQTEDPAEFLFAQDAGAPVENDHVGRACGFYWTEGLRGLGWAVDAVPTLKGGSTIGIPSPPAIWLPNGRIVTPDIRDAERLQGFEADWTGPAEEVVRRSHRWKLIGNAVTTNVAEWLGILLRQKPPGRHLLALPLNGHGGWPRAAYGSRNRRFMVNASSFPLQLPAEPLISFLKYPPKPLSAKATIGFVSRLKASTLVHPGEFMRDLERHIARMQEPLTGWEDGRSLEDREAQEIALSVEGFV